MTLQDDIAALRERVAQATVERDGWRAAGREEKYLEAYFRVETLEQELDDRLRALYSGNPGGSTGAD